MANQTEPEIYRVRAPFATMVNGAPRIVAAGTTIRRGHPLIEGNEHNLEPFEVNFDHQADAAEATAEELRDRAKELGVTGYSKMNKEELAAAIAEAEQGS